MSENIVELREISKQFNNIWVLKKISFAVAHAEVHTLFGENGAGKSVLMKILSGVFQPDNGEIRLRGEKVPDCHPARRPTFGNPNHPSGTEPFSRSFRRGKYFHLSGITGYQSGGDYQPQ